MRYPRLKIHAWYVFTNEWILAKKLHNARIQSSELKNVNKLKDPSDDTPIPFGRKKIAIGEVWKEGGTWVRGGGRVI